MTEADRAKAALQTYLYGYPLVYNLEEAAKLLDGTNTLVEHSAPNRFAPARHLLGPEAKFVSPNNDTLYLMAACDLSVGPLVMEVPDTNDRYYVLQFVDAWSNNFAYVGRRATGTKAARYLLAPSGYAGAIPEGMDLLEVPSRIFAIVGRVQVNGENDLAAVHAIQDQFTLRALSTVQGGADPGPGIGIPVPDPRVAKELVWWEQFRVALAEFPPPAGDATFLEAATALGLGDASVPMVDIDPTLAGVLAAGQQQGESTLESLSKTSLKIVNGWSSAMHAFDYNLDHCGPGTLDAPEWKIADRTTAYVTGTSRPLGEPRIRGPLRHPVAGRARRRTRR